MPDYTFGPKSFGNAPLTEAGHLQQFHKLMLLIGMCVVIAWTAAKWDDSDLSQNARMGMLGAVSVALLYSVVYLPGPHSLIDRLFGSIGICYLAALVYFLFQSPASVRATLNWIDSEAGVPIPEKKYAEDCRVYTPENATSSFANLMDCLNDVHISAHALGWVVKMLIIRNVPLCFVISVSFEFLEVSLRHQLNNFYECWWDSIVMDILVCNSLGIYIGSRLCSALKLAEQDWGIGSCHESVDQSAQTRLQPKSCFWSVRHWKLFSSCKNFVTPLWLACFLNLLDLSHFYLKRVLWIPASHWILFCRVLLWGILTKPSVRDFYQYTLSGARTRLGSMFWLVHLLICIEWILVYKNTGDLFSQPMPTWLKFIWLGIGTLIGVTALVLVYRDLEKKRK